MVADSIIAVSVVIAFIVALIVLGLPVYCLVRHFCWSERKRRDPLEVRRISLARRLLMTAGSLLSERVWEGRNKVTAFTSK